MDSSDDESLAGLTQEPSQARINALNFQLRDPTELIDCSGNQQSDFDNFVGEFCSEKCVVENLPNKDADNSLDLFPTLDEENKESVADNKCGDENPTISMAETVSFLCLHFITVPYVLHFLF